MPTDAYPPQAIDIRVSIDPQTPYAGKFVVWSALFQLDFVVTRSELEQLRDRIDGELRKSPLPERHRSGDG